jgi:hypothetical protein
VIVITCGIAGDDDEDLVKVLELDEEGFLVDVEDDFTELEDIDLLELESFVLETAFADDDEDFCVEVDENFFVLVESLVELEILTLEETLEDVDEVFFVDEEDFFEVDLTEVVAFLVEEDTGFPWTQLQSLRSCC